MKIIRRYIQMHEFIYLFSNLYSYLHLFFWSSNRKWKNWRMVYIITVSNSLITKERKDIKNDVINLDNRLCVISKIQMTDSFSKIWDKCFYWIYTKLRVSHPVFVSKWYLRVDPKLCMLCYLCDAIYAMLSSPYYLCCAIYMHVTMLPPLCVRHLWTMRALQYSTYAIKDYAINTRW